MRLRVHSKTGKPIRCNGVVFGVEPRVIDTAELGWNEDQIAEICSSERHRALYVFDLEIERALRDDGPTMEEFIARGYPAEAYPPQGFTERRSPAAAKYRRLQREERARREQPAWMSAIALSAPSAAPVPAAPAAPIAETSPKKPKG